MATRGTFPTVRAPARRRLRAALVGVALIAIVLRPGPNVLAQDSAVPCDAACQALTASSSSIFVADEIDDSNVAVVDNTIFGDALIGTLVDSDGDGLADADDAYAVDNDGDGLSDADEEWVYGTAPYTFDTDGDGLSDYHEVAISLTDPLTPNASPPGNVEDPGSGVGQLPAPALDCGDGQEETDELGRKTGFCAPVVHEPERGDGTASSRERWRRPASFARSFAPLRMTRGGQRTVAPCDASGGAPVRPRAILTLSVRHPERSE
ncbi:MAG: hypothetical protein IT337_07965, partial [Thermomicrobiales bacterium]|nr:hypothetical protein [Thermomicrobiales bacterium]